MDPTLAQGSARVARRIRRRVDRQLFPDVVIPTFVRNPVADAQQNRRVTLEFDLLDDRVIAAFRQRRNVRSISKSRLPTLWTPTAELGTLGFWAYVHPARRERGLPGP